jgi:ATP-dependent Clp protease adaptor protein ClpS
MNTELLEVTDVVEVVQEERALLLCNDDVNTFEHVIECLVKICNHTAEQAEQCAYLVHYTGKCSVKNGSYDGLKPLREALQERGLTALIK